MKTYRVLVCMIVAISGSLFTSLPAPLGAGTAEARAQAVQTITVTGTITNHRGQPARQATVLIYDSASTPPGIPTGGFTDSNGNFSVDGVVPGWIVVRIYGRNGGYADVGLYAVSNVHITASLREP